VRTSLQCVPCLVRQALEAASFVVPDNSVRERVLRETLRSLAESDFILSPPALAQIIHRRLRDISGSDDPYRAAKARFTRLALDLLPGLRRRVAAARDPLSLALRLAIAGNVIDLGAGGDLGDTAILREIDRASAGPFSGDIDSFRRAARRAKSILYLADNAGELVFDRFLIERLGPERVTVAVRGGPVINDATRADAREAGLEGEVELIDNGSDAPGTILKDCSPAFRRRFRAAGLIIAKGQGNAETLSGASGKIFSLFKVKCAVMASRFGLTEGTLALVSSPRPKGKRGARFPAGREAGAAWRGIAELNRWTAEP